MAQIDPTVLHRKPDATGLEDSRNLVKDRSEPAATNNRDRSTPSGPKEEERQLLLRHHQGDKTAFRELLRNYQSPVFGYLVRCGIPEDDRDDLFQEIFLRVHRSAPRYDPRRSLHPWIFTIVANLVRNFWRRQRVRELTSGEAPAEPIDQAPLGSAAAESRQDLTFVELCITQLPRPQRQVLLLISVEGLSLKEASATLDTPLNTIKTRLHRARLALARALGERDAQEGLS